MVMLLTPLSMPPTPTQTGATLEQKNLIKNGQQIQLPKKVNPEIYRLFSKNSAFIGLGEIDSKNLLKAVRLISTNLN